MLLNLGVLSHKRGGELWCSIFAYLLPNALLIAEVVLDLQIAFWLVCTRCFQFLHLLSILRETLVYMLEVLNASGRTSLNIA